MPGGKGHIEKQQKKRNILKISRIMLKEKEHSKEKEDRENKKKGECKMFCVNLLYNKEFI